MASDIKPDIEHKDDEINVDPTIVKQYDMQASLDINGNMIYVLKRNCPNPNKCMAVNIHNNDITNFFENYQNMELIDKKKIQKIGDEGSNGFLLIVPYKKQDYSIDVAIKFPNKQSSDNLYYEYYVGKHFINKYTSVYPTFVETYNLVSSDSYNYLKDFKKENQFNENIENDKLFKIINENSEETKYWEESCKQPIVGLQLQYFSGLYSLKDFNAISTSTLSVLLPSIMVQVYYPLVNLMDEYTHYDLHADNVLLYKPYSGKKYIEFNYHMPDGKVYKFNSEYIVKIIDYGRSYFKNTTNDTGKILNDFVCKIEACKPNCGDKVGYGIINGSLVDKGEKDNIRLNNLFPNKLNKSADIRLMKIFQSYYEAYNVKINFKDKFSTSENMNVEKNTINNVKDALNYSLDMLGWKNYLAQDAQRYSASNGWKKMAIMNIYGGDKAYTLTVGE